MDGSGNCIEIEDGVVAIGSGGLYAYCMLNIIITKKSIAAAKALIDVDGMDAETIGRKSMKIAADLCVYTNHEVTVEILQRNDK